MKRNKSEEVIFRALQQVETPEYDILSAVKAAQAKGTSAKKKYILPRGALLAACLAVVLVMGAAAVSLGGGWAQFFGTVPEKVITPVGVNARSGDYTITLEETIVDQDGAAFLLSLKRTDGGVLEGEPELYDMWLEIKDNPANMGFHNQKPVRSEDGTTIYDCIQFQHDNKDVETLEGHELVISFAGIINDEWTEDENDSVRLETVSLASLAPVMEQAQVNFGIYADMENPDFVTAMDILDAAAVSGTAPLHKHGESFSLAGGVLSQDGKTLALSLCGQREYFREENYLIRCVDTAALTDTRTGERVDIDDGPWGRGGYTVTLFELGQPLTLEDLPYLEATVEYDIVKYISDVPFELAFTVADSGYRKEYTLDQQVDVGFARFGYRHNLHVTTLQISALNLRLSFDDIKSVKKEPLEYTPCKLIYDDGKEIPLRGGTSLGGGAERPEEQFYLTFLPVENVLLDSDRAAALQLGDTRIELK